MFNNEEVAKELQREYLKEWRMKNKMKVIQYQRNYWLKKAKEQIDNNMLRVGGDNNETISENK